MSRTSMLLAAYNLHTSQRARALDQVYRRLLGHMQVGLPQLPTRDECAFQQVGEFSDMVEVAKGSLAGPGINCSTSSVSFFKFLYSFLFYLQRHAR
jgi:hypothetical protein